MTIRLLLGFAWLSTAAVLAFAMEPEGGIGDLGYDTARWDVRQRGDDFEVLCRSARCDASVTVRITPGASPACNAKTAGADANLINEDRDPTRQTIARPGFDIHVVTAWTGCRNARPPSVHACTVYKGRTYRFDSPVLGCRGGPGFSDGALDFLEQLSAQ